MADMRISGLASGMNIDEIVTNLMKAERMPLDKINQKKTYTEWQRDDYRTMNTALSELNTQIFEGIGKQASFNKKTVTVSDENAISVKNVNSTSDFSGEIKNVTLASAARMTSIASATIKLTDKLGASYIGETIAIKAINKDGGFDQVQKKDSTGKLIEGQYEDKVFSYKITVDDTLESVINKVNAGSGVTVFFDEGSQKFSIMAKNTGSAKASNGTEVSEIFLGTLVTNSGVDEFSEGTSKFFKDLMKMQANNDTTVGTSVGTTGENAKFTYNGLKDIERSSNTFTINGAEITLKQAIPVDAGPVTFSSKPDVDAVYDTIKKFVDSYNGLITNISEKTSEKKNKDYPPLTDAQREALSDDEIKRWDDLAKKGTLRRDSTLSSLLTKMRTSIYSSVSTDTTFKSMDKIGISTKGGYPYSGKLEIGEDKLRAAIAEDPNGIYNLFMADVKKTVDGDQVTDLEKSGIARRLRADLGAAMKDISEKAGKTTSVNNSFTLGKLLDDYEDKISAFEEKMKNLESRYYKQFNAMETAINKANSQSASLASFFTTS